MSVFSGRMLLVSGITLFFFIADRVGKWFAVNELSSDGLFLFSGITGVTLERNSGIAYGIALPSALLIGLVIVLIIICFAVMVIAYRKNLVNIIFPLVLIVIGAFSNLLDRLLYDSVIDWLVLTSWPVFNIADVMITVGAVWLGIITIKKKRVHES